MMKKIFIASLLFVNFYTFSQKYELGKVTIDELKEKVCPADTSAVAAYLFNVGKTYFDYSGDDGFSIITEVTTKIKIYKKEGYDLSNQGFRYYTNNGSYEKVDVSKAITYNLVNGKIEKSKLSSNGEFDEKINKFWSRKKIAMPNVKEGSIIEFKFQIVSPFITNFPEWEFQKRIPVNYSEYVTCIPEYFFYNVHSKGYFYPIAEKSSKQRSINYTYVRELINRNANDPTGRVNSTLNFQENSIKYSISNVPALRDEGFINNIENYRTSIIHELSGTKYPDSPYKSYANDWESVANNIYENDAFGAELKKTGYFEKDIDGLILGINSQEKKIAAIFNFVKERMNWNEYYGVTCDDGVKKAYEERKGNVAEINLMLISILRYAGVEANPILISTRSNGISLFPSRTAFNYVLAGVELENQVVLLDATDKNSSPNVLPIRDLNWFGRIVRKNESSAEIDLMPKTNSKEVINILANLNSNGEVSGKIRDQYFDYKAFGFRETNNKISKDSYIEKLEKGHKGLEIIDYDVQNSNDLDKPIIENYSFKSTNSVEIIGDKMYVLPLLFFTMTENPFKQEIREYPVDFVYPDQEKFNISLTIPEGYVVEILPLPKAFAMPENIGSLKYNISNNGNQIQLLYTLDINQAIVGSEYYEALKNFFKEIVNKQTEKIVLKKG